VPPHPGPLPWGEGASLAGLEKPERYSSLLATRRFSLSPRERVGVRGKQVLRGANSVTYSVAQVSKPAVSRISKSASTLTKDGLPTGKSAIQQVWKPALRHRICARLH